MIISIAAAAAAAVAQPSSATPKPAPPVVNVQNHPAGTDKPAPSASAPSKAFDMAMFSKIFDRMFPPQPEPDPARLALARQSTMGLLPDGAYAGAMGKMLDSMADGFLNMSEADFAMGAKSKTPPSTETLHQKMLKDDPYFDQRMTIIRRIVGEEMLKLSAILEPKMREGLARSMARRLDAKQLADLNAFLATDSGKAYGQQTIGMWADPDMLRAIMGSMPEMMTAMPNVMKRIEAETASLPKPKKVTPAPKSTEVPKTKAQ